MLSAATEARISPITRLITLAPLSPIRRITKLALSISTNTTTSTASFSCFYWLLGIDKVHFKRSAQNGMQVASQIFLLMRLLLFCANRFVTEPP